MPGQTTESLLSVPTILTRTGKVGGDYDCGHFLSVGNAKHLEFDPRNTAGQCKFCNMRRAGASSSYRPKLIERIGLEAVEALEADQTPRRLRTEDYKQIIADAKVEIKRLEQRQTQA